MKVHLPGEYARLNTSESTGPQPALSNRLVFEQAFEGLIKVVPQTQFDDGIRNELLKIGIDLRKPLQVAYPLHTWMKFSAVLAHALFPNLSTEQAHRQLGHRLVDGYFQTLIGKAMLPMLKLIGPKRALLRTDRNFRSANNYTETRFEELGPTDFKMWMNEVDTILEYTAGIIEAGITAAGATQVAADIVTSDSSGCTFRVQWH